MLVCLVVQYAPYEVRTNARKPFVRNAICPKRPMPETLFARNPVCPKRHLPEMPLVRKLFARMAKSPKAITSNCHLPEWPKARKPLPRTAIRPKTICPNGQKLESHYPELAFARNSKTPTLSVETHFTCFSLKYV